MVPHRLQAVLMKDPSYFEKVAEKLGVHYSAAYEKITPIRIGFEGNFGASLVNPRTLTAELLGHLVAVEGIVTKCSGVRPKVVRSAHYCPATVSCLR